MSIQEKKALMNIFSSVLISSAYCYYMFIINGAENTGLINEPKFWARFILIYIPVVIIAKIVIHIIFVIVNKIATNEDDPGFEDEFDKLIQLKANRNGTYFFIFGFFVGIILIAMNYPIWTLFASFLIGGLIADVCTELWRFYFYRKGF